MSPDEAKSRLDQAIICGARNLCSRLASRARSCRSQEQHVTQHVSHHHHHHHQQISPGVPIALKRCLQSLRDQQLATGITLLVVSYVQHCDLARYHLPYVLGLCDHAWVVQIIVAEFETYFEQNRRSQNILQVVATACFWGLLVPISIPFWNDAQWVDGEEGLPVQCLWDTWTPLDTWTHITQFRRALAWALWQGFVLWGVLFISSKHSSLLRRWVAVTEKGIQSRIDALGRKLLESRRAVDTGTTIFSRLCAWIRTRSLSIVYPLVLTSWICLEARASRLFVSTTSLTLCTALFTRYKFITAELVSERLSLPERYLNSERDWGSIGQILPLVLLVLPVISVTQSFEGKLPEQLPRVDFVDFFFTKFSY